MKRGMISDMRQVILYPDREDGGWVAEVPSLSGCVSVTFLERMWS